VTLAPDFPTLTIRHACAVVRVDSADVCTLVEQTVCGSYRWWHDSCTCHPLRGLLPMQDVISAQDYARCDSGRDRNVNGGCPGVSDRNSIAQQLASCCWPSMHILAWGDLSTSGRCRRCCSSKPAAGEICVSLLVFARVGLGWWQPAYQLVWSLFCSSCVVECCRVQLPLSCVAMVLCCCCCCCCCC
jgi:hypothetical protein